MVVRLPDINKRESSVTAPFFAAPWLEQQTMVRRTSLARLAEAPVLKRGASGGTCRVFDVHCEGSDLASV